MRTTRMLPAVVAAAILAGVTGAARGGAASEDSPLPRGSDPVRLDPGDFSVRIDNPQWPMSVGSRWVYRVTDMATGKIERQVITVTNRTKLMADGIRARVVHDVVTAHGKPVEVTDDWYAQDRKGNVWYFGEHTASYENGKASDNGSWQAGVHGAMPGSRYRRGRPSDLPTARSTRKASPKTSRASSRSTRRYRCEPATTPGRARRGLFADRA